MQTIFTFIKKEAVLSIAIALAAISVIFIPIDRQYLNYIDFRTIALLFCLMTVIAGVRRRGMFSLIANRLVSRSSGTEGTVLALTLAAFFLSMLITNDVSLITLVPLTLTCFEKLPAKAQESWLIPTVVMETVAANLGSMATPIGNPQNLYLYGLSDISLLSFMRIILPYSVLSLIGLIGWIKAHQLRSKAYDHINISGGIQAADPIEAIQEPKTIAIYAVLFLICLSTVARIIPWPVSLVIVLIFVLLADRKTVLDVDYSLLGTFLALFIFIGNLGRITAFRVALTSILNGHEVFTAIAASQIMSNVPAAILLSGFTDKTEALIIGTNLGGLGTLIASMASLISYKIIVKESRVSKGRYLLYFTGTNIVFLIGLIMLYLIIGQ